MKISRICDLNKSSLTEKDDITQIKYLDTGSLIENSVSGYQFFKTLSDAPSRARRKVEDKTILYSTVRPNLRHFGILENPDENVIVSTGFVTIDIKPSMRDKVNAYYLYYLLTQNSITNHLQSIAENSVTAYPSINPSDIANLDFDLPDIYTQHSIVSVFRPIDEKIGINNHINEQLEAMAKQLYDYWFVQFDFPNEEGKPYKSSGGKMVWNEKLKKEIPEGWTSEKLDNRIKIQLDRINSKDITNENYTPIEVLPRNQMSFSEVAPLDKAVSGLCKYDKGDILLSNRRVYFHKVSIAPFDGITRDTVYVVKVLQPENLGFIFETINTEHFFVYAIRHSYGTEQPVLGWQSVADYYIVQPNNGIDLEYSRKIKSLIDSVVHNELENKQLTSLRDFLLPLLMNGQVSIKD